MYNPGKSPQLAPSGLRGFDINQYRPGIISSFLQNQFATTEQEIYLQMTELKRVVLDVLKPHQPNVLTFASRIADNSPGCQIHLMVSEVDDKTETVILDINGALLQYDIIEEVIRDMGGSVHSIDEVNVENTPKSEPS